MQITRAVESCSLHMEHVGLTLLGTCSSSGKEGPWSVPTTQQCQCEESQNQTTLWIVAMKKHDVLVIQCKVCPGGYLDLRQEAWNGKKCSSIRRYSCSLSFLMPLWLAGLSTLRLLVWILVDSAAGFLLACQCFLFSFFVDV